MQLKNKLYLVKTLKMFANFFCERQMEVPPTYLQRQQQQERLNAVEASVDKVTHEQVVCVWNVSSNLEELLQVKELTVDVATDLSHTTGTHYAIHKLYSTESRTDPGHASDFLYRDQGTVS